MLRYHADLLSSRWFCACSSWPCSGLSRTPPLVCSSASSSPSCRKRRSASPSSTCVLSAWTGTPTLLQNPQKLHMWSGTPDGSNRREDHLFWSFIFPQCLCFGRGQVLSNRCCVCGNSMSCETQKPDWDYQAQMKWSVGNLWNQHLHVKCNFLSIPVRSRSHFLFFY